MSNGLPGDSRVYPRGRVGEQLARTLGNTYNWNESRDKIRARVGDNPMRSARDASMRTDSEANAREIESRIRDKRNAINRDSWQRAAREMSRKMQRRDTRTSKR